MGICVRYRGRGKGSSSILLIKMRTISYAARRVSHSLFVCSRDHISFIYPVDVGTQETQKKTTPTVLAPVLIVLDDEAGRSGFEVAAPL